MGRFPLVVPLALGISSLAACSILNAPGEIVPGSGGAGGSGGGGGGGGGGETTASTASSMGGAGGASDGGGGTGGAPPAPVCGNGALEAGEECDDGDLDAGDACSGQCKRTVFSIAADAMLIHDAPDVAPSGADGGKGFVVVWRQLDPAGPLQSVLATTLGASGKPLGAPVVLGDSPLGAGPPRVGANADQRALAAWIDPGDGAIRFHVLAPDGSPAPAGLQTIPASQASAISDVASKSGGELCLAWRTPGSPASPASVLARCFDAQGSVNFTQTQTLGPITDAGMPGLWSAGSVFIASWPHTDGTLKGLALGAAGQPQGAPFTIPSNGNPNLNPAGLPRGAMGAHVAVFEQGFGSGPSAFTRVTKREFQSPSSSGVLDSFVSSSADHDEEGPAVAAVNGKFVVAWTDHDVNFGDIIAQAFNDDGTKLGPPIQVNKTDQAGTQQLARVAANADGDVMFVWQSQHPGEPLQVAAYIYPRLLPP